MPYEDGRFTACISSQAGCGMGCTFCATGQMGFSRQLTDTEIFTQVQKLNTAAKQQSSGSRGLTNIVFMGMGEPLANYVHVLTAIRRIKHDLGISYRSITVSTVGIAPRIQKLADEPDVRVNLAVSLHHATDEKRRRFMPVAQRYPLAELLEACRYYVARTRRRLSFEWAMVAGVSDTEECAHELGALLQGTLPGYRTVGADGVRCRDAVVPRELDSAEHYGSVQRFSFLTSPHSIVCQHPSGAVSHPHHHSCASRHRHRCWMWSTEGRSTAAKENSSTFHFTAVMRENREPLYTCIIVNASTFAINYDCHLFIGTTPSKRLWLRYETENRLDWS